MLLAARALLRVRAPLRKKQDQEQEQVDALTSLVLLLVQPSLVFVFLFLRLIAQPSLLLLHHLLLFPLLT